MLRVCLQAGLAKGSLIVRSCGPACEAAMMQLCLFFETHTKTLEYSVTSQFDIQVVAVTDATPFACTVIKADAADDGLRTVCTTCLCSCTLFLTRTGSVNDCAQ